MHIFSKAIDRAKQVPFRGVYLDLLAMYEYLIKKNYQYPSTPSLSHMFALDFQLDNILDEGLDNRFNRHEDMANLVRNWAKNTSKFLPMKITYQYTYCYRKYSRY